MISTLFFAALTFTSASALPNTRRDEGNGFLRLTVSATLPNASDIEARHLTVSPLENVQTGTRYLVDFFIGTPQQPIAVALDTGSSETWVNPQCSTSGGTSSVALCNSLPVYDPTKSSTSQDQLVINTLGYGKGSADIEYYTDNFAIGVATITGQIFGVGQDSVDLPTGLMGVGPGIELVGYPCIIDTLAAQNVIQSRAFSLDLRGVDSPDGAIIFGGIDTMKYIGNLEKCPIIPADLAPDGFDRYWIYMVSVGITKPGSTTSKLYEPTSADPLGQPVFLDSGGTLSRLPTTLFNAIVADFPGAIQDGTSGLYLVDCALGSQDGTVDFGFGNTIINVPYNEFIWHIGTSCYLGLAANDDTPVLGDSFLRAAFVVYDQDNQNLLLANAANCGTNLVAIGRGVDAVPSIAGACTVSVSSTSSSSLPSPTSLSSGLPTLVLSSPSSEITSSSAQTSDFASSTLLSSDTFSSFSTTTLDSSSSIQTTSSDISFSTLSSTTDISSLKTELVSISSSTQLAAPTDSSASSQSLTLSIAATSSTPVTSSSYDVLSSTSDLESSITSTYFPSDSSSLVIEAPTTSGLASTTSNFISSTSSVESFGPTSTISSSESISSSQDTASLLPTSLPILVTEIASTYLSSSSGLYLNSTATTVNPTLSTSEPQLSSTAVESTSALDGNYTSSTSADVSTTSVFGFPSITSAFGVPSSVSAPYGNSTTSATPQRTVSGMPGTVSEVAFPSSTTISTENTTSLYLPSSSSSVFSLPSTVGDVTSSAQFPVPTNETSIISIPPFSGISTGILLSQTSDIPSLTTSAPFPLLNLTASSILATGTAVSTKDQDLTSLITSSFIAATATAAGETSTYSNSTVLQGIPSTASDTATLIINTNSAFSTKGGDVSTAPFPFSNATSTEPGSTVSAKGSGISTGVSTKAGEITSTSESSDVTTTSFSTVPMTTEYTTSTVFTTSVYTITSCAPAVTDCPSKIGKVTTEVISLYTTVCPVSTPAPVSTELSAVSPLDSTTLYTTSTVYATSIYTITSCAPTVTDCPSKVGKVTTEIISLYTTVCPVGSSPTLSPWPTLTPSPLLSTSVSTVFETKVYTITSCAAFVTDCPGKGKLTTEVLTSYSTVTFTASPVYSTGISTFYETKTYTITADPVQSGQVVTETLTSYTTITKTLYGNVITTPLPEVVYSTLVSTIYSANVYTLDGSVLTETLTSYSTKTLTSDPKTTTLSSTIYLTKTFTITVSNKQVLTTSVFPVVSTRTYTVTGEPITKIVPISLVIKPSSLTLVAGSQLTSASGDSGGSVKDVTFTKTNTALAGVATSKSSISPSVITTISGSAALPSVSGVALKGDPADASGIADPSLKSSSTVTNTKSATVVPVAKTTASPTPVAFTGEGSRLGMLSGRLGALVLFVWALL